MFFYQNCKPSAVFVQAECAATKGTPTNTLPFVCLSYAMYHRYLSSLFLAEHLLAFVSAPHGGRANTNLPLEDGQHSNARKNRCKSQSVVLPPSVTTK